MAPYRTFPAFAEVRTGSVRGGRRSAMPDPSVIRAAAAAYPQGRPEQVVEVEPIDATTFDDGGRTTGMRAAWRLDAVWFVPS